MKQALNTQQLEQIETIENLTSVFESIASLHIAQIKDKVLSSGAFFNELWQIYSQLRVDGGYERHERPTITDRKALVAITSESALIGDIDQRIVDAVLREASVTKSDVYVVGSHGSLLFSKNGLKTAGTFSLPYTASDKKIDVGPIAQKIKQYEKATVYYQTYVSLMTQEVARIELFSAVATLAAQQKRSGEFISNLDYLFEPSMNTILAYMESIMMQIALAQVVLDSKLAQYASRYNTMSNAKTRAHDLHRDLNFAVSQLKRTKSDERTKEILSSLKILEKR